MLKRVHDEERGVAMIVSLSVAFVVLILSTVVVAQSIHTIESSGYDRERLLSVNAAEAGTNHWYAYLESNGPEDMAVDAGCDAGTGGLTISDVVQSGPSEAAFTAVGTFYAADGSTVMNCSTFSDSNYPAYVEVASTGTINGAPARTIDTFVRLTPNFGGFGAAIFAVNSTNFSNNFTVTGNNGNDGDIFVLNGNLSVTNAMTLYGNVYVPFGFASLSNATTVKGSLWARDDVTVASPAIIEGNALSSLGDILKDSSGSQGGDIYGDATAAGDVDEVALNIQGQITENTTMPDVPTQSFPQITAATASWISEGYTLVDLSTSTGATLCAKARDWIKNRWSTSGITNALIRIDATCNLTNSNNDDFTIYGHLGILSDGGFNFTQRSSWNGTTGSIKNIHFISVYTTSACTGTKDITVSNNTSFNSYTNVMFYTPCTASMNNTNSFTGQVMSKTVSIGNLFKMAYKPVLVPGTTGVTGFKQDISYIHE